jgi:hypothetical protein
VPRLQGRQTPEQRRVAAELQRQERELATSMTPERQAQECAELLERTRACEKHLLAELAIAAERAKARLAAHRAEEAEEKRIRRGRVADPADLTAQADAQANRTAEEGRAGGGLSAAAA